MEINFGNFFKDIETTKEKEIYSFIYGLIIVAILAVFIAGGTGYFTAKNLIEVFNSKNNSSVVADISTKATELKDIQTRLQMIKTQFEDIKYPDRNMLRGSINKDLAEINFNVQTFTLKDYDSTNIVAETQARKKKSSPSASQLTGEDLISSAAKMPDTVEIIISGRIPVNDMIKLFTLIKRTDRFWFVNDMSIYPPEGQSEFFGKSFILLPNFRKKEMFDLYQDSFDDPYVTITFTFYTFVRSGTSTNPEMSSDSVTQ